MYKFIDNPYTQKFVLYDSKERIRRVLIKHKSMYHIFPDNHQSTLFSRMYMSWEYDTQERIIKHVHIIKQEGHASILEHYFKIEYNTQDELVYYEDHRGNIWHKHWQVSMPFEDHLQTYLHVAQIRTQTLI